MRWCVWEFVVMLDCVRENRERESDPRWKSKKGERESERDNVERGRFSAMCCFWGEWGTSIQLCVCLWTFQHVWQRKCGSVFVRECACDCVWVWVRVCFVCVRICLYLWLCVCVKCVGQFKVKPCSKNTFVIEALICPMRRSVHSIENQLHIWIACSSSEVICSQSSLIVAWT